MRYASIRSLDISNGEGMGVALFVQGCPIRCKNCFNQNTWSFTGGKEWTEEVENKFLDLLTNPHIKRVSILGGEPLASTNLEDVWRLMISIRQLELLGVIERKEIWLYTGFTWESIINPPSYIQDEKDIIAKQEILKICDVLVDGPYVDELKDYKLKWRGSSNQRVIDVQKSLNNNEILLYCD